MKIQYFIINDDGHIGTVYESEKHDTVIVFNTNEINLEKEIIIHSVGGGVEKKDVLELIVSVLPK